VIVLAAVDAKNKRIVCIVRGDELKLLFDEIEKYTKTRCDCDIIDIKRIVAKQFLKR
jgi:hypothetical protein